MRRPSVIQSKMVSVTIYLEPSQMKELRALSKATGIPLAVLVRRGIDGVIEREGDRGNISGYERALIPPLPEVLSRARKTSL